MSHSLRLGRDCDHTEQPVGIVIGSRGEKEFVRGAVGAGAFAELQSPQLVNRERPAGPIGEVPEELSVARVKRVDLAVFDVIGNQNGIAEWTEIRGGQSNSNGWQR